MTEDEAKTKWCPMTQSRGGIKGQEMCIGGGCMLWRWIEPPIKKGETVATHSEFGGIRLIEAPYTIIGNGYCGLGPK